MSIVMYDRFKFTLDSRLRETYKCAGQYDTFYLEKPSSLSQDLLVYIGDYTKPIANLRFTKLVKTTKFTELRFEWSQATNVDVEIVLGNPETFYPMAQPVGLVGEVGVKDSSDNRINPATKEQLPSSLTSQGNLKVSVNEQGVVLSVRDTHDMLVIRSSVSIGAGGDGNVDITVPSGELWEVGLSNHIGSGADISLTGIWVSPDGGVTWYPVKSSHIGNGEKLYVTGGNKVRGSFHNAGAGAETAYLCLIGRKLKVGV
jgi:hypothetical protein